MNLTVWKIKGARDLASTRTLAINELQVELVRPDVEAYNTDGDRGTVVYLGDSTMGWYEVYHVQETLTEVLAAADLAGYPAALIKVIVEEKDGALVAERPFQRASGTVDANTPNKLTDSTANFDADGDDVAVGDLLKNITDGTFGFVKARDSGTVISCKDAAGSDLDLFPDGDEEYQIWSQGGTQEWVINPKFIVSVRTQLDGAGALVQYDGLMRGRPMRLHLTDTPAALTTLANAGEDILENFPTVELQDGKNLPGVPDIWLNKYLITRRLAAYLGSGRTAVWAKTSFRNGSRTRRYEYTP